MAEKEERVKLLGFWTSPFTCGSRWLSYSKEDLINKSPLFLQLNPVHKKVPVLIHNRKPILESNLILEYIDRTWTNNPILPQDPYEKARALFLAKFVDEQVAPAGFRSLVKADKGIEVAVKEAQELIMFLEKEVTGKDFFNGKTIGFLDMVVGSMIPYCGVRAWEFMGINMIPEEKFPELNRWIKKLNEIEMVRECVPPRDEHMEHLKRNEERVKSAIKRLS